MNEIQEQPDGKSRAIVNPMDLTGRSFLVTGGSSGIGQGIAIRLSELGGRVIVAGRDQERLGRTVAGLAGDHHHAAEFDLTRADLIGDWLQQLAAGHGPLDGIVHSAGVSQIKPLRTLSLPALRDVLTINLEAGFMLAKAFRRSGVCTRRGSIVFVSSVSALRGQAGMSAYAASKGALLSATRALALELAPEGLRINCVVPAFVDTPMYRKMTKVIPEDQLRATVASHPLGIGKPEDVANAAAFLLSDAARWITGESLVVDGGYLA